MFSAKNEANRALTLLMAFALFTVPVCATAQERDTEADKASSANAAAWDFDDVLVGQIPSGWKVAATNRRGPLATWQVIEDKTAPSGDHVLALTRPNHRFGGTFNLCWTDQVAFLNGEIRVRFKAVQGEGDQGGGVIWRARDQDNYYIARFNPLEDNFRVYYVRNGVRRTLADASITLSAGEWHAMRIVQRGDRFEGYLDGRKLVEGSDELFATPGGVGLWTKADAVTSFDDFSVNPLPPEGAE